VYGRSRRLVEALFSFPAEIRPAPAGAISSTGRPRHRKDEKGGVEEGGQEERLVEKHPDVHDVHGDPDDPVLQNLAGHHRRFALREGSGFATGEWLGRMRPLA
jgi:hypothetical protein